MNNDWLNRKENREKNCNKLCNIDKIVREWQSSVSDTWSQGGQTAMDNLNKINNFLNALASNLIDYVNPKWLEERLPLAEVHKAMVNRCINKLHKLDVDKIHAFNFFSTIMLGVMRRMNTHQDFKEAREEYREYRASRNSRNRNRWQAQKAPSI